MEKLLKVNKPFSVGVVQLETGDILKYSEDDDLYVLNRSLGGIKVKKSESIYFSEGYAKALIDLGYVSEVKEDPKDEPSFVNVFDEIDKLIEIYTKELDNLATDMKDEPEILKIEKETVLANMLKVLNHLKSLKK